MGNFGAGQSIRRIEDRRFLTGTGRYTDDIDLPGQLHLYVLRSPHAHADIAAIDTTAACAAAGVAAVLTAADLDELGYGPIPVAGVPRGIDGKAPRIPARWALAKG